MAATIDERVVEMRFNNKQFESGVSSTMSLLDKFKAKLNFKGSEKGLDELSKAANKVDMSQLEKSVSTIEKSFTTLGIVGITVLQNITNSAVAAGTQIVKSLTITPVMSGMQEYELKLNSIQTILANVKRHGSTIDDVSAALDELNHYADKTIYNFGQMTTAIGMFTTAGVELDRSVASVKGISNLAAFVGAPAQDASRAMYQLSQALSTGVIRLTDWMSLEHTAGMAGVEFQDRLKDTARILGENVDAAIEKNGNFRESLKEGWLTTEVLTETLKQFAGEVDEIYLKQQGWSDAQIESIMELGRTATESATIVKSFTQLLDTLAEAAQSGWAESWEIIIGNLDEAKVLWTAVANEVSGMIDGMSERRNEMLRLWKDQGGRDALIQSFANLWQGVLSVIEPVEKAFRTVFPYISGEKLADATKGFEEFTRSLKLSEEAAYTLEVTMKLLLLPLRGLTELIKMGVPALLDLTSKVWTFLDSIIAFPSKTDVANISLRNFLGDSRYTRLAKATTTLITRVSNTISFLTNKAKEFVNSIASSGQGERVVELFKQLLEYLKPIGDWVIDHMINGFEKLVNMDYSKITNWAVDGFNILNRSFDTFMGNVGYAISKVQDFFNALGAKGSGANLKTFTLGFKKLDTAMVNFFKNFAGSNVINNLNNQLDRVFDSFGRVIGVVLDLTTGLDASRILIYAFGTAIVTTTFSIGKLINSASKALDSITGLTTGITDISNAISERIKPDKFKNIAVAITILAGALVVMSLVDSEKLISATAALGILMGAFTAVTVALALVNKFLLGTAELTKSFQALSSGLIMISGAFLMLAAGLLVLSNVDPSKVANAMLALVGVLALLVASVAALSALAPKLSAGGFMLLAFSGSMLMLVNTMIKIAEVDTNSILDSFNALLSMTLIMISISSAASRVKLGGALGLIVAVQSLIMLADVLEELSNRDPAKLLMGVTYSIPLILELSALMLVTNLAGKNAVKAGVALIAISGALILLSEAVEALGAMEPAMIFKGITAVGLLEILFAGLIMATKFSGKNAASAGAAIAAMSVAILVLVAAMHAVSELDPEGVAKGIVVIDGMLALFALIMKCSTEAKGSTPAILAIGLAITALTGVVIMLTFIPFDEAMKAVLVLGSLMVAFAVAMKTIGAIDTSHTLKKITTIVLVVGLLGAVVTAISILPMTNVLENAAALSLVMMAVTAAFKIMSNADLNWKQVATDLFTMTGALAIAVGALALIAPIDAENILTKATALSEIMLALSAAFWVISKSNQINFDDAQSNMLTIGAILASATLSLMALSTFDAEGILLKATALSEIMLVVGLIVSGLGAVTKYAKAGDTLKMAGVFAATMTSVAIIVGAIGAFASLPATQDFMANGVIVTKSFEQLIPVLYAFAGLTAVLALVGKLGGTGGFVGVGVFDTLIVSVGAIIIALGALVNNPATQDFINKGAEAFAKIGDAIGGFFGGIVGKFLSNSTDGLADSGQNVSDFAEKVTPFMEAVKDFDASSTDGIRNLVESVSLLANLPIDDRTEHVATFVGYLDDMVDPIKTFCEGLGVVNIEAADAAGVLVSSITDLVDIIPESGGIKEAIVGTKDLKEFANGLTTIAPALTSYYLSISAINADAGIIETSTAVAESLAAFANNVPRTGGLLQAFFGESDMEKFGANLVLFGTSFVRYSWQMESVNAEVVSATTAAADSIAKFASGVPLTGGMLQDFFGESDIATFGERLVSFGTNFARYSWQMESVKPDVVTATSAAASSVAEFANKLKNHGGWVSTIFGDSDVAKFGSDLVSFGTSFARYSFQVSSVNTDTILNSMAAAEAVVGLHDIFPKNDPDWMKNLFGGVDMATFGSKLASFGESFKEYYNSIVTISVPKITSTTDAIRDILTLSNDLNELNTKALDTFGTALESIAEAGIDGFISKFEDAEEKIKNSILMPINTSLEEARNVLNIKSNMSMIFYDLGKYAVQGYINGTNSMRQSVIQLWTGIGKDSKRAIQEELDMHSPSVEFEKLGVYTIQGYLDGLDKQIPKVIETFVEMGDDAKDAGKYVVLEIADGITEEMSAEEAASKKAQNIIDAFSEAMEGFNLNIETRNKEMDLFDALFPDATEEERLNRQYQVTSRNLEDIMETTKLALAEFKATQMEFGDTAIETQKAHNKFLDAFQAYVVAVDEYTDLVHQMSLIGVNIEDYIPAVTLNEMGEYFVKNIGLGITADTSAEEAAQIKAENIAIIFGDELSKMSQKLELFDLDYEIWQKANPGASVAEQTLKEIENAQHHFDYAAEVLREAYIQYETSRRVNGEEDANTIEFLIAYKQAISDAQDAEAALNEAKVGSLENIRSESEALIEYNRLLSESADELLKMGFTMEEIKETFAKQSNWDLYRDGILGADGGTRLVDEVLNSLADIKIEIDDSAVDIFEKPANATRDHIASTFDELTGVVVTIAPDEIEKAATAVVDTYNNTITAAKPSMVENTQNTVSDVVTSAVETVATTLPEEIKGKFTKDSDFSGTAMGMLDGFINGLLGGESEIKEAGKNIARTAIEAGNEEAGIHSPSTVMYDMATYMIDGFVLGLTDGKPRLEQVMTELLASVTNMNGLGVSGFMPITGIASKTKSSMGAYENAGSNLANNLIVTMSESMQSAYLESKEVVLEKIGFIFEDIIRDVKPLNYESVFEHGQWLMVTIIAGFWSRKEDFLATANTTVSAIIAEIKLRENDVYNSGANLTAQFAAGMLSNQLIVVNAAIYLAYQANIAFRNELDINSPSGVFAENGMYVAEGFADGLMSGSQLVKSAAKKFAEMAEISSWDVIQDLADDFRDAAEMPITLNPVVDLDTLKKDIEKATLDINVGFDLSGSIDKIDSIASSYDSLNQVVGIGSGAGTVNYNFNQNNYSPKSLSNSDIYRNTRNQFAMFKERVKV